MFLKSYIYSTLFFKISAHYSTIEEEFEATIRKAFVDEKTDFIYYDYVSQDYVSRLFLNECINYGIDHGWLIGRYDARPIARLTEKGKIYFGLSYSS